MCVKRDILCVCMCVYGETHECVQKNTIYVCVGTLCLCVDRDTLCVCAGVCVEIQHVCV